MDLFDEFKGIVQALDGAGIDYAVVGAVALAIHGMPRTTTDIDILIRPEDSERVEKVVQALGFRFPSIPMTFSDSGLTVHRLTKIVDEDVLTLDMLLVCEAMAAIWDGRIQVETDHGRLWVVSRDGLIEMKVLSGRLRDLVDVKRLQGDEDD